MTEIGQRLQELQAEVASLRTVMGAMATLGLVMIAMTILSWARQRRMSATLAAIWTRLEERDADVIAAGAHAREEMARHQLRAKRRANARCGAGRAIPSRLPPS